MRAATLVSKFMRVEEDFQQRRQTHTGNPKPEKTEATQPIKDLMHEVRKISLMLEKQESTAARPAARRRLFQMRWFGPPPTRLPTRKTPNPMTADGRTKRKAWKPQGVVFCRTANGRHAMCIR
ncbi:hypothetical protein T02_5556 [Trichinella nativa]|uniref:Uncharacterized protein n=1 Tax=Trichinella nativa TaxID=6335 RepID=A0A0V1LR78_9BILA|nr:hypothetical protein T02_5556 [Trichinella nativa]